jgi:hypothetical protein
MTAADIIATFARLGAELGDCGRMCDECAFKKGALANNDELTTQTCADILAYERGTFYCHKNDNGVLVDTTKPCAGFLYAEQFLKSISNGIQK